MLNQSSLKGRGEIHSTTGHDLDVGRTFALSYNRLNPADPIDRVGLALLGRAACFAPGEPIPRPLLLVTLGLPEDEPEAALQGEDGSRLVELGLLENEVQIFLAWTTEEPWRGRRPRVLIHVFLMIHGCFPHDNKPVYSLNLHFLRLLLSQPHLREMMGWSGVTPLFPSPTAGG